MHRSKFTLNGKKHTLIQITGAFVKVGIKTFTGYLKVVKLLGLDLWCKFSSNVHGRDVADECIKAADGNTVVSVCLQESSQ